MTWVVVMFSPASTIKCDDIGCVDEVTQIEIQIDRDIYLQYLHGTRYVSPSTTFGFLSRILYPKEPSSISRKIENHVEILVESFSLQHDRKSDFEKTIVHSNIV
jgi:hypothetical protein